MSESAQVSTARLLDELWSAPRACQEAPGLFFAADGESASARVLRERAAAALCADCPVRAVCLAAAVRTAAEFGAWGVWGGFTAEEIAVFAGELAAESGEVAA